MNNEISNTNYELNGTIIEIGDNVTTEFLNKDIEILKKESYSITRACMFACDAVDKTLNSNKRRLTEIKSIKYINSNIGIFSIIVDVFNADSGEFVFEHTIHTRVTLLREFNHIREVYVEKVI